MGRVSKALSKADIGKDDVSLELLETTPAADAEPATGSDPVTQPDLFRPQVETAVPEPPAPADHAGMFQQEETGPATGPAWDERLLAASGTASPIAEQFRRLRTCILHPPSGEKPARTILIVSAAPEEGKTFACANLGIALAQGVEEHALLIDCDLRRPALAGMFGLGNDQGLANYLQHGTDLGQLIRKTGLPKLSIIPGGPPPINPAELLGSDRLAAMISEVATRYGDRYILFDSPPHQKAAETAILVKHVDGIVVVIREGKSRREDVGQLVETLGPEKVIGVIFNAYQTNLVERRISGAYDDDYYSSYSRKER